MLTAVQSSSALCRLQWSDQEGGGAAKGESKREREETFGSGSGSGSRSGLDFGLELPAVT